MAKEAIKAPIGAPQTDGSEPTSKQLAAAPASNNLPAYLQDYTGPMGGEGIDNEDVTIPRLKIAQAISDEVKMGGMKEGSLFINVTQSAVWVPGDPPLPALIVAHSKEYMLWRSRQDGDGGLITRARPVQAGGITRYKWDNPNTDFEVRVGGKVKVTWSTKEYIDQDKLNEWGTEIPGDKESGPAATAHHNYLLMLPSQGGIVVAVSLSRTGVKVARNLNALIKMGGRIPLAVRKFGVSTLLETAGDNSYMNWQFKPAGILGDDEADIARQALAYAASFRQVNFSVDQSDAPSTSSASSIQPDKAVAGADDQIPF